MARLRRPEFHRLIGTKAASLSLVTPNGVAPVLFHFKLTRGCCVEDIEGLELPDLVSAREEARGLASDLSRRRLFDRSWSGWTVIVTNETGHQVLAVPVPESPG